MRLCGQKGRLALDNFLLTCAQPGLTLRLAQLLPMRHPTRLGTASGAEICGPRPDKTEVQAPKTTKTDVKGRIEISGPPGEFISDGRSHTFVPPSTKLVVDDSEPGSIAIEIGDPENSWEIDLSAPAGGRFETVT